MKMMENEIAIAVVANGARRQKTPLAVVANGISREKTPFAVVANEVPREKTRFAIVANDVSREKTRFAVITNDVSREKTPFAVVTIATATIKSSYKCPVGQKSHKSDQIEQIYFEHELPRIEHELNINKLYDKFVENYMEIIC